MMRYLRALAILIRKNFLLALRDSGSVVIQFSATFLAILLLFGVQKSFDSNGGFVLEARENRNPVPKPLPDIPRCVSYNFPDCLTLAYAPDNATIAGYVNTVATNNGIPSSEVKGFASSDVLNKHLFDNPNRTQGAYVFEDSDRKAIDNKNVSFIIQINTTKQSVFPIGVTAHHELVVAPAMLHAMNSVLMPKSTGKALDVKLSSSIMPHPTLDSVETAFGVYGPILLFALLFISFVVFCYKIVDEKERGLRSAMKLAGLSQSQHFLSWGIMIAVSFLVSTLLIMAFGFIFRFKFFTKTAFVVNFVSLYLFSLSLTGWIFLFAVLARRTQSVTTICFNFFILSYILSNAGSIIYAVDSDGKAVAAEGALFLRQVFAIVPVVMFTRVVEVTSQLAETGFGLTWKSTASNSAVFPVRSCWNALFASGLGALVLAIYLDNILPSPNGTPLSPLYFLFPRYWGLRRRRDRNSIPSSDEDEDEKGEDPVVSTAGDEIGHVSPEVSGTAQARYDHTGTLEDADVGLEREAVASGRRDNRPLVFKSLRKVFGNFTAVENFSLSIPKNSVVALLGHNGSGKSTIMSMLSTVLAPTSGDILINGMSVKTDQVDIRKTIGVCPQFDRYWDLLSGREHIDVFAALRGMNAVERQAEITTRIEEVGLTDASSRYAGSYSGGMLRRLSVAIALTGNPSIIALDEMSTGTDPVSRRELWTIVEKAKAGRVVLLITHSMAEAQALGDTVAILASSKLRVLGTSLHLKSKFGCGYRITCVVQNSSDVEKVGSAIAEHGPGGAVSRTFAGAGGDDVIASFVLPQHASDSQLARLVAVLEREKALLGIVNFSVDQTTLDDVFKSITALSEDVDLLDQGLAKRRSCCPCFCR
jgi:ABC-type multidrug transport system ATPase subunit